MDFGLSEPQEMLRRSLAEHLARNVPLERVRHIMESKIGHDPAVHEELGDLGMCGLLIDEQYEGSGLGLLDATIAAQELARAACPVNFHSAYVLAPLLISSCGSEDQKAAWLPKIAAGQAIVSVVLDAPGQAGNIDGVAAFVADAAHADALLVEQQGALYLLDPKSPGISIAPLLTVDDTRRLAEVTFGALDASASALPDASSEAVTRALQAAQIALAADAFGAAQKGLEACVDYAKQRQQFGRIIGSYQAVKHMCAEAFAELDPVQSMIWYAAHAWDEGDPEISELAPLTKAHATETATYAVTQATQVFGGIGFTWECDMHLWYKRAGFDRQVLGGPTGLREQAAQTHLGS